MNETRSHTEILFNLLARWQEGEVSHTVLRRDLSGLAANTDFLEGKVATLEAKLEAIQQVVDKQAEDEGLWFVAARASEAYLQQELRQLHAVIEAAI